MAMFDDASVMSDADLEALFGASAEDEGNQDNPSNKTPEKKEDTKVTENEPIDLDNLFVSSESVGNEDNKVKEDASSSKSTSPSVLSSLAKTLKEEGIFLDLEDTEIEGIKDADSFKEVIEKQLKSQLDERQKRVDEALGVGVEPDVIRKYENTLAQLSTITEDQLKSESEQAEQLRKYLIKQDFINRGYSQEKADKMVAYSVSSGTDIDDAIEALDSIKTNVKGNYDAAIAEARAVEEQAIEDRKKEAANLRKSIMEDKTFFGDLQLTQAMRQKVLDAIIKPVWRDPETGDSYTAIQKYEKDDRVGFLRSVGIIYAMTDGFKNLEGLVKGKVSKEVNKGFKELEHALNNTQRNNDGTLNFASGVDDANSFLNGLSLDI